MLLDSKYTIIPLIKFSLLYDNDVKNVITVKTKDKIECVYKKNGEKFRIVGIVTKIGCNFNSSLGAIGTTAYMQVDGSCRCAGQVEFIQPSQVLSICILSTTDTIDNPVCSVDNQDQRVSLLRENEACVLQYSLDGVTWKPVTGSQGPSAYECAVKQGFVGTEDEWLASLKGEPGNPDLFVTKSAIIVSRQVGGYSVGDIIPEGTKVLDIIQHMLSPEVGPNKIYFGVSNQIPTTLQYLTPVEMAESAVFEGVSYAYTSDNQYFVYAYKKNIGELKSIKDCNCFENIDGWIRNEYADYYIYYTKEPLTVTDFKLTFKYTN